MEENMRQKAILAVDLGGTKISSGLISAGGELLGKPCTTPTGGTDPEKAIISRIFDAIEKTLKNARLKVTDVAGIGIGATGPLDMKEGLILECPFLPTLHNFPLRKTVRERFGIPVFLDNDANCFGLGECFFGAGRGCEIVLGYTLGTGLGCAIVIGGRIFAGATQHAGEVGTSPYQQETIEDIVSGSGISRIYQYICGKDRSAREIAELGFKGEESAIQTWEQFGEHLAYAVSWGINALDPDIVILGGSIANAMELFAPAMEKSLRKNICPLPAEKTKVVKARLGDHAGLIGAACLVLQARNKK
jgi:glucokinase